MLHKVFTVCAFCILFSGIFLFGLSKTAFADDWPTSDECGECHMQIYDQWKASMHSQSSPFLDPIVNAMYRKVVGDPGKEGVLKSGKFPVCIACHVPLAALDKKTKLDSQPYYKEGVGCTACHRLEKYNGVIHPDGKLRLGISAYSVSKDTLQGTSGRSYRTDADGTVLNEWFHPFHMKGNSLLKVSGACMGCHEQRPNSHGVPLCATGKEVVSRGASLACQFCHMPLVQCDSNLEPYEKGWITDHSLLGGHSAEMTARAMSLDLKIEEATDENIQLLLTLKSLIPHKFPTGAPFRWVYVKIKAYDNEGQLHWENFKVDPIKEDPKSVLYYLLGDEEGHPSDPPNAKKVLGDTRLLPGEERLIRYSIPQKETKLIKAEAFYNLLLPSMLKKLEESLTSDLKGPKQGPSAEIRL